MTIFDVIILGGGASGSVCAYYLSKGGKNVCVIDANDTLAKKLLVTGNGRCNLTNSHLNSGFYNKNIDSFLKVFNQNDTINFFKSLGVATYFDQEGRCYPVSNTAKSVEFALQKNILKNGVTFAHSQQIVDVDFINEIYVVKTDSNVYKSKNIVFATGFNKNIDGIIKKFDISVKKYTPSLVALKTKQQHKRLDGVRISDVKVTAQFNSITKTQFGEVLFKKEGLSGICIFNLSTLFARNGFNGKIFIDILPNLSVTDIINILNLNKKIYDNAIEILCTILHKEVGAEVLSQCNLPLDAKSDSLTDEQLCTIANKIKSLQYDVVGYYDNNQVFSGGVELKELSKNLQSTKQNNMYFCGEICNIDGECGGYNLQWAFTSAFVVAKDILAK